MADISKISPNGGTTVYNLKDETARNGLSAKQDKLTWDSTPISGSLNPVTSGGVYTALQNVEAVVEWSDLTNQEKADLVAAVVAIVEEDIGSVDSMEF